MKQPLFPSDDVCPDFTSNHVDPKKIERKFIEALRHHLHGWHTKVKDFSEKKYNKELQSLKSDALYSKFQLATDEYTLIRLMGRMSISIGRRLGEIYDKVPRLIAKSVFDIPDNQIARKMGGKLELDICLPFDHMDQNGIEHIKNVIKKNCGDYPDEKGVGIEIRYNFNPNDSSRLRKDVDMANYLIGDKLTPIYLIFSSISPRDEAIARLKRAGWHFMVGDDAHCFANELLTVDILTFLDKENVRIEIEKEIKSIMNEIYTSYAFKKVMGIYDYNFSA